jgi:D-ribose pyranose/furanose isomerase RbsD
MKKAIAQPLILILAITLCVFHAAAQDTRGSRPDWHAKLQQALHLLGHRNWILVVDSAYPLQSSPGVETIDTGADHLAVVKEVLAAVDHSIQVRPIVYMDAELPFVPESDAPGVTEFRRQMTALVGDRAVTSLPHEQLIHDVDDAGKTFNVLILKTRLTIPYTSVFLRLDCKYWSADAEVRLRAAMQAAAAHHQE